MCSSVVYYLTHKFILNATIAPLIISYMLYLEVSNQSVHNLEDVDCLLVFAALFLDTPEEVVFLRSSNHSCMLSQGGGKDL